MAAPDIRVELDHVARRKTGSVAGGTAASLSVNIRGGGAAMLFDAETGGSTITQPFNPDSNGVYTAWVEEPGAYEIVETIDSVTQPTLPWEAAAAKFEDWHVIGAGGEPAFQNNWVNVFQGLGFAPAAFMRSSEGVVKLRGLVGNGTDESVIFTLPVGYRPGALRVFAVNSNDIGGRVDVSSAGLVDPFTTNNVFIDLSSIQFVID